MRILLGFLFVFSSVLFFGNSASAKEVTVNNPDELIKVVDDLSENTVIQLSKDFSLDQNITLKVNKNYNLKILGNKKRFDRKILFEISTRSNELRLKDFIFDGNEKKGVGFQFKIAYTSSIWIYLEDSTFENSVDTVIETINEDRAYTTSNLEFTNVLIQNNKSKNSGAVNINNSSGAYVYNSTFKNNENSSSIIGGGAITLTNIPTIWFFNSVFENNKLTGVAASGVTLGGGAIYSNVNKIDMKPNVIANEECIFKNNQTNLKDNQHGGAIFKNNLYAKRSFFDKEGVQTTKTIFSGNRSSGFGGAIAIQTDSDKRNDNNQSFIISMDNSIFTLNESIIPEDSSKGGGSAVALFNLEENNMENERIINSNKTTFYKNTSSGGNNSTVFVDNYKTTIDMKDTILGFNIGDKSFENINSSGNVINIENSFGIDNGLAIPGESEKIFGKYPVKLRSNYNEIKAGYPGDRKIVPSIQIIPRFTDDNGNVTTGISNETFLWSTSSALFYEDFRGIYRGKLLSAGAIDTTSILYDANGGNFNKKELTEFEGKEYYEGNNPKQLAKLYLPNSSKKIVSASKDLKINRKGAKFIGWSTNRKALKPESKFAQGKIVKLDQQLKLYAVWKVEKHNVRFYSNGKTDGVLSKSYRVNTDDEVEIPKTVKVKRKGYKFIGWSYLPNATKADKSLSLGTKLKITKSLKIYAVWKKTK